MTDDKKKKGLDEPDWIPNPEDKGLDSDVDTANNHDADSDKIMQRKIDEGIKQGMERERGEAARRQAEDMRQTLKEWKVENSVRKELGILLRHKSHPEYLAYSQTDEAVRAAKSTLMLADGMSTVKTDVQPETKKRLIKMADALVELETNIRGEKSKIKTFISNPEDIIRELDELHASTVSQLMTIISRMTIGTPTESAEYMMFEAPYYLKELYDEILEMSKGYRYDLCPNFAVFKFADKEMAGDRVSDIGELNGKSGHTEAKKLS